MTEAWAVGARIMEFIAFAFVATGFALLVWMVWRRPQVKAANCRLAAEIGRSILATWNMPEAGREIARGVPHQFRHLARSLLLIQRVDADRERISGAVSPEQVRTIASDYVRRRVKPQIKYYSVKGQAAKKSAWRLEIGSLLLSLTAVISAGVLAFGERPEFQHALWAFAKLAAATAAPVSVSILVIHEIKRREARYHEMKEALEAFEQRIAEARSSIALRDLMADLERMLLGECHEWWILAKANVAA